MDRENGNRQHRNGSIAAVRTAAHDHGVVEIATLSLAGLTLALFEIAHYFGTAVLPQMFAQ